MFKKTTNYNTKIYIRSLIRFRPIGLHPPGTSARSDKVLIYSVALLPTWSYKDKNYFSVSPILAGQRTPNNRNCGQRFLMKKPSFFKIKNLTMWITLWITHLMKISIQIEKTGAQCTEMVVTLNIPGLTTDIWLCVSIVARFFFFHKSVKWAIHLV